MIKITHFKSDKYYFLHFAKAVTGDCTRAPDLPIADQRAPNNKYVLYACILRTLGTRKEKNLQNGGSNRFGNRITQTTQNWGLVYLGWW